MRKLAVRVYSDNFPILKTNTAILSSSFQQEQQDHCLQNEEMGYNMIVVGGHARDQLLCLRNSSVPLEIPAF